MRKMRERERESRQEKTIHRYDLPDKKAVSRTNREEKERKKAEKE